MLKPWSSVSDGCCRDRFVGYWPNLDIKVLRKWCYVCLSKLYSDPTSHEFLGWWELHKSDCDANFSGRRSSYNLVKVCTAEQVTLYWDDLWWWPLSYRSVAESNPYGTNHPVTKHECIGHVQKRMYTHLRKVKKDRRVDWLCEWEVVVVSLMYRSITGRPYVWTLTVIFRT